MNAISTTDLMKWIEIGAMLINTLGLPIAAVIRLFREAGGSDEQALELVGKWADLQTSVADRIAFLKAGIAAIEG
jgi:hypothetical protein